MRSMVFGESPHHSTLIKSYVFDQVSGTEVATGSHWLTEVFHALDIRSVLLLSLETKDQRWNGSFQPQISKSFKYHKSIFSLRAAAKHGCPLCALIWQSCRDRLEEIGWKEGPPDHELARLYDGEIFLGTDSWFEAKGAMPSIIVDSIRSGQDGLQESQLCVLDAFTRRGKWIAFLVHV